MLLGVTLIVDPLALSKIGLTTLEDLTLIGPGAHVTPGDTRPFTYYSAPLLAHSSTLVEEITKALTTIQARGRSCFNDISHNTWFNQCTILSRTLSWSVPASKAFITLLYVHVCHIPTYSHFSQLFFNCSQLFLIDLTYPQSFTLIPSYSQLFPLDPAWSLLFPLDPTWSRLFLLVPGRSLYFCSSHPCFSADITFSCLGRLPLCVPSYHRTSFFPTSPRRPSFVLSKSMIVGMMGSNGNDGGQPSKVAVEIIDYPANQRLPELHLDCIQTDPSVCSMRLSSGECWDHLMLNRELINWTENLLIEQRTY